MRVIYNENTASRNGKLLQSLKTFVRRVHDIEPYAIGNSGSLKDKVRDKHHWEWTKQAVITLEKFTEAHMLDDNSRS
jgi:hypothetical protein